MMPLQFLTLICCLFNFSKPTEISLCFCRVNRRFLSRLHVKRKALGSSTFAGGFQRLSVEIEKEKASLTQFKQPYYRGEIIPDSPTNNSPIKVLSDNQRN